MFPKHKPTFIVGLQKSGTSLAFRLLNEQHFFEVPFKQEGRYFWGDYPPFSPQLPPCGLLYQASGGQKGHHLSAKDIDDSICEIFLKKLQVIPDDKRDKWLNKNPYNSVRVPWLRKLFPNAYIIAIFRRPESNVFSLLKKHIPHNQRGLGPENGWWGVKPKNWTQCLTTNKIKQLALQWKYTNIELLTHHQMIDMFIDYEDLCLNPEKFVEKILAVYQVQPNIKPGLIKSMNDEYKRGSRLLSKNRNYHPGSNEFLFNDNSENIEIKPLLWKEVFVIRKLCQYTWLQCKMKKTKIL